MSNNEYLLAKYNKKNLSDADLNIVEKMEQAFSDLFNDKVIGEYINERKERFDWGELEALSFSEKLLPFIHFLKEKSEACLFSFIVEAIDNYEGKTDE